MNQFRLHPYRQPRQCAKCRQPFAALTGTTKYCPACSKLTLAERQKAAWLRRKKRLEAFK